MMQAAQSPVAEAAVDLCHEDEVRPSAIFSHLSV
jgi:hypothetical protein